MKEIYQTIFLRGSILILIGWFITTLSWPLGGDIGTYAWIGDVIVSGGTPYKDAWDCKGPLVYPNVAKKNDRF